MTNNVEKISLVTVSDAASEPLTTAQAKTFLRIDSADEDTLIDALVASARLSAERYMSRSLITRTLKLVLDSFGTGGHIDLPAGDIQSVTSLVYIDANGSANTLSTDYYVVDTAGSRILLKQGYSWPTGLQSGAGVEITYTAGYGNSASDVPADILTALRHHVAALYQNRGEGNENTPEVSKAIYDQYKTYSLDKGIGA